MPPIIRSFVRRRFFTSWLFPCFVSWKRNVDIPNKCGFIFEISRSRETPWRVALPIESRFDCKSPIRRQMSQVTWPREKRERERERDVIMPNQAACNSQIKRGDGVSSSKEMLRSDSKGFQNSNLGVRRESKRKWRTHASE